MKLISFVFTVLLSAQALAWQPTKTVDVTVPFPVGSGNDQIIRPLAAVVEKNTGVKFIINNRPGAGGTVGNEAFTKMPADGHAINVISAAGPFAMDKTFPNFQTKPPYTINDFTYVMVLGQAPLTFFAHPKDPVDTPKKLADILTREPVSFADNGAAGKLALESFLLSIDARKKNPGLVRPEHRGPVQTLTDVAGGHVRFGVAPLTVSYPLHQGGQIKIIALTTPNRISELPNVGTISEVVKDFDIPVQWALVLPKGASPEIVAWYNKAFTDALNSAEIKEFFAKNMFRANPSLWDPKVFTSYMQQQDRKFQPVVNTINQSVQQNK